MKIVIIGGGIGGLTTAIALQQRGITTTIYEAAQILHETGAGIWIAANAMNVYERLGLAKDIKQGGNLLESAGIGDHNGSILSKINFTKISQRYGNGTTAIHRGKLQRILLKYLTDTPIITGKRLKYIEYPKNPTEPYTLYFEDETTDTCDIIIGADGIKSAVRKYLFGEIPFRYSGQTCWRGIAQMTLAETKNSLELWGTQPGLRASVSQVSANEVYWYITVKTIPNMLINREAIKSYLIQLVAQFKSDIQSAIELTSSEAIIHGDLYDFKPIDRWYKNNIVLVGDAAHATTPNLGQGACQAIEDAYVLAECLSQYPPQYMVHMKRRSNTIKKKDLKKLVL